MRRQLVPAVVAMAVFTLLLGVAYPLLVTGISQVLWHDEANGSLVTVDGRQVGSALIGQQFTSDVYFWPRPSAVGADGYDSSTSGGSNLGPTSEDLLAAVQERVDAYRAANGLAADVPVPVDAVTTSGSGLDPDISVANARLQVARVAAARGVDPTLVQQVLASEVEQPSLGFLDTKRVNVLALNLALDRLVPAS